MYPQALAALGSSLGRAVTGEWSFASGLDRVPLFLCLNFEDRHKKLLVTLGQLKYLSVRKKKKDNAHQEHCFFFQVKMSPRLNTFRACVGGHPFPLPRFSAYHWPAYKCRLRSAEATSAVFIISFSRFQPVALACGRTLINICGVNGEKNERTTLLDSDLSNSEGSRSEILLNHLSFGRKRHSQKQIKSRSHLQDARNKDTFLLAL